MLELVKYEWMRSKKFIVGIIGTILICMSICLLYGYKSRTYNVIWFSVGIFIMISIYVIEFERRSKLIASDLVADNSEHMLTIPKRLTQIISMHYIFALIEGFGISVFTSLFIGFYSFFDVNETMEMFVFLFVGTIIVFSMNTTVSIFLKKKIEHDVIAVFLRVIIWVVIVVIIITFMRFMPLSRIVYSVAFVKNYDIILLLCLTMICFLGCFLNCKIITQLKNECKSYRKVLGALLSVILLVFITIQFYTYFLRQVDDIDIPFANDELAIGNWTSVGFVKDIEDFDPLKESIYSLPFKGLEIKGDGDTNNYNLKWTKGYIIDTAEHTASEYRIKNIDGIAYLFMQWKSGDYIYFHMEPGYYVMRRLGGGD